ncbi:UNVERIFIED_CONTAM: Inactive ubiquitin carboxyl-terminal hydrolase 54 [Gekko kuhli]
MPGVPCGSQAAQKNGGWRRWETLKEKQAPRTAPKTPSSTSRLRDLKETVSNMIHNRPSQTGQGSPRGGKGQAEVQPLPRAVPSQPRDWEMESTSSESKSSSSSRYRPTWRPKRESLNIDSIFSKEKRKQCGYTPLSPFSEDAEETGTIRARDRGGQAKPKVGVGVRWREETPRALRVATGETGSQSAGREGRTSVE